MKRSIIVIFLLFSVVTFANQLPCGMAMPSDTVVKEGKARQFFDKIGKFADEWFMRGVDTSYLSLPKHRFKLSYLSDVGSVYTIIRCFDVPYYENIDARMKSNVLPKMGFLVGFRNINFGYLWNLYQHYTNFKLSLTQNAFGIELQRRQTFYAKGYIDASAIDGRLDLEAGSIAVSTTFLSGYVALNRKRFSMPAAFNQSYIQKHSAGSVLLYADYMYTNMAYNRDELITRTGGMHEIELYQTALGVGYGYNYTPNGGKILMHISGGPLLAFFNRMLVTGDSRMFLQNNNYNIIFSQKIKPQYKVYVTGRIRAAFVYNINERFLLAVYGVCNNIRFRSKDTPFHTDTQVNLDYNSEVGMRLMTWDWNAVFQLGVRF